MNFRQNIRSVFRVLSDKDAYFENLDGKSGKLLLYQTLVLTTLAFVIGLIMGGYHSFAQSLSSGIKLVVMLFSVMLICFPSFFIIQRVLGSRMKFWQMTMIVMSGFILTSVIVLSFTPIIIFFMAIGSRYHFLQLLHVAIFIFGGFWGLRLMVDALKYACEQKNIYPQTGVSVFKVWIVIMAFVSIQLAWNLRPFVGQRGEEFKIFRHYKGNFYTAILYSFHQLSSGNGEEHEDDNDPHEVRHYDQGGHYYDSTRTIEPIKTEEE
ncbi:MAG: hypothetical protein GC181_08885 [Bacteroidetes bacterium]|nr:hypothetical protein [Bacteroidota bacterium]